MPKLLLVEDNPRIQIANKDMLELLGYDVAIAMNLAEARRKLTAGLPDVIVLDIMLPDGSGLDFLRELRQSSSVPVFMLTALGTDADTVAGFSTGADDYLAKPYAYPVLAARVEALLRRAARVPEAIHKGRLTLDVAAGVAMFDDTDLLLTKKDFFLLLIFVQNEGRILSMEYLFDKVWNTPISGDSNALKSAIKRLRAKLEGSGYCVELSKGEGYSFEKE